MNQTLGSNELSFFDFEGEKKTSKNLFLSPAVREDGFPGFVQRPCPTNHPAPPCEDITNNRRVNGGENAGARLMRVGRGASSAASETGQRVHGGHFLRNMWFPNKSGGH